jgi:hypothetical protein
VSRAWKTDLQTQLADAFGLTLTVAHYPTGASKWNPIEHRLFSEISKNGAGAPLDSYQKIFASSAPPEPSQVCRSPRTWIATTIRPASRPRPNSFRHCASNLMRSSRNGNTISPHLYTCFCTRP